MNIKIISVESLRQKIKLKEDILIVDVRENFERESGFINDDINISLNELNCDKLPRLELPIIFYCRSGVRSFLACQNILKQNASLDVYNLEGGIIAWNNFNT